MKNKLILQLALLASMVLLISNCSTNKADDPLIIPPHFNEIPDLKNPEKPTPKSSDKDLQELKNLLLKSDS